MELEMTTTLIKDITDTCPALYYWNKYLAENKPYNFTEEQIMVQTKSLTIARESKLAERTRSSENDSDKKPILSFQQKLKRTLKAMTLMSTIK